MTDRLKRDLELLTGRYPEALFQEEGQWIFLPRYLAPNDVWEQKEYAVSFQLRPSYPDIGPYGICVSPRARGKQGEVPSNYVDNADPKPPFEGAWGRFSWELDPWRATPDLISGTTLLNYVESIRKRFEQGP